MGPLQDLAKTRALDKLFFETGVEEEDLMRAFLTHRISERPEFKAIVAKTKDKVQEQVRVFINKLAGNKPSTKPVNPMAAAGASSAPVAQAAALQTAAPEELFSAEQMEF